MYQFFGKFGSDIYSVKQKYLTFVLHFKYQSRNFQRIDTCKMNPSSPEDDVLVLMTNTSNPRMNKQRKENSLN